MEVQVVLAQIGEGRHVEHEAVDAPQDQGVTTDLHDDGGDRLLAHHAEHRVHVGGLGGGSRGR